MKHNFVSNDVKKIALDEYLEGNATMTQVSDKYKICMNTFSAYKRKHTDYVNDYTIYLANQKSGIPSEKPVLDLTKKPRKQRTKKETALDKEINEIIRETNERKEGLNIPKPNPGLNVPIPKPLEVPQKNTIPHVQTPKPLEMPHKNNGLHVQQPKPLTVQPIPRTPQKNEIFSKPTEPTKHISTKHNEPIKHDNLKYTKPHTVKPQETPNKSKSFKIVSYEDEITRLLSF
jgi:hypothetical protein